MRPLIPNRRLLFLALPVFFANPAFPPVASAGQVQVVLSYDDCRRKLDDCESRLSQICAELAAARASLDQALANQSSAASSLAAVQSQIQASSRSIADAQGRIGLINQSLPMLRERAAAARAAYDSAKARADATTAEVINYQSAARTTFESSPAYIQVITDLSSAKAAYDQQVRATFEALRSTNDYAELYERFEDLEAAVEAQRYHTPVDQAALSAASVEWMNAKNALEHFKGDHINNDATVQSALAQVNAIEQARQQLVDRFTKDLASDPKLKDLVAAGATAQQDAQFAATSANTTAADVTAREQAIANLQATINTESARLAQAQTDAAAWQSALYQYAADAANADGWLRTLWARETACRRERDCASEEVRICLAQRDDHNRGRDRDDHSRREHDGKGDDRKDNDRRESQRPSYAEARGDKTFDGNKSREPQLHPFDSRQRREDTIASAERSEREALAARHERDRGEEAILARLPVHQRQQLEQKLTDERRQRELDRQKASAPALAPVSIIAEARAKAPPPISQTPRARSIISEASSDRAAAQRQQLKEAEAREASAEPASARQSPPPAAATPVAKSPDKPSPEVHAPRQTSKAREPEPEPKPAPDRQQREVQARAEQDRQEKAAQEKASQEKASQSRAARDREQAEERAKVQQEHRRQGESQAKSEDDQRRQRDNKSKAEEDRRQRDSQPKAEQPRAEKHEEPKQQQNSDRRSEDSDRARETPRANRHR